MTDPWAYVREMVEPVKEQGIVAHDRVVVPGPEIRALLADADALLAVERVGHMLDLLRMADYIEDMQSGDEDWEWPRDLRKFATALTALPEHLK